MVKPLPGSSLEQFEAKYVHPKAGKTLIVGSAIYRDKDDRRRLYPDAIGVDMQDGQGVDLILDLEGKPPDDFGPFAHIECMSVLEHSRRLWFLAANLERLLEIGGTIFVSVPFCWRFHGYPNDFWRMTPEALPVLFPNIQWIERKFASNRLKDDYKIQSIKWEEYPYHARTETVGFGIRR